jgi:hypothetical protein
LLPWAGSCPRCPSIHLVLSCSLRLDLLAWQKSFLEFGVLASLLSEDGSSSLALCLFPSVNPWALGCLCSTHMGLSCPVFSSESALHGRCPLGFLIGHHPSSSAWAAMWETPDPFLCGSVALAFCEVFLLPGWRQLPNPGWRPLAPSLPESWRGLSKMPV